MKIIGHSHVLQYLGKGLQQQRLSPSLLFIGQDGVGKKSIGIELVKSFSCQAPLATSERTPLPACGACLSCQKVASNNHPDLLLVNRDLQTALAKGKRETQTAIKIETVRHLTRFLSFKPSESSKKSVIIEDAHNLTNEAANALLKILEEPPPNAQILLIANDEHNLPTTILSRCAVLRFHPIAAKDITSWLKTTLHVDETQAEEIGDLAGGSLQKALEIKEGDQPDMDISDYALDEFFHSLSDPRLRGEGRNNAERAVIHLIEKSQKKLEKGDLAQTEILQTLLKAKKQIEKFVPPRLVLENLYLQLQKTQENL